MELHQTCPRAAQYGLCYRRRTSAERSALKFGGIIHKVMEARYRAATELYAQSPEVEKVMVATAQVGFKDYMPPEDDFRNLDRAVDLIHRYGERYPFEDFEVMELPNGKPFIEVPFAFPLVTIETDAEFLVQVLVRDSNGDFVMSGEAEVRHLKSIRVLWIGRIDMGYRSHGGVYILDHKTSSIATNMAEFEISHQFYGYVTAAEEMLAGAQVHGIVINRMVCRKPTRTGEAFTFERKLIPVQRGVLGEWKTDMVHMIIDFLEMVRRGYMPKHTQWCVGKFGTCQFHKVCTLDSAEQKHMMLWSGEFEDNIWNPLK
jgi:hypothetical protein